jgi:hypothetical protein
LQGEQLEAVESLHRAMRKAVSDFADLADDPTLTGDLLATALIRFLADVLAQSTAPTSEIIELFDLFRAVSPSTPIPAPTPVPNPLVGLHVQLEDKCRCGAVLTIIGEGAGPHITSLTCAKCERHRGWLPRDVHDSILKIVKQFGIPNQPVLIRRSARARNPSEERNHE